MRRVSFFIFTIAFIWNLPLNRAASAADALPGVIASPLTVAATSGPAFHSLPPARTRVSFTNQLNTTASARNRVLNNGSGVSAGDFDNDGWVDLFFCSLSGDNRLYKNLGNLQFADVTQSVGLKFKPGFYRSATFADLNGDGKLDLLIGTVGRGVLVFLNDGQGKFLNATTHAGTASPFATETVALADIDGNGTLDLYVTNNRTDDIRDWPRIPVILVNGKPTVPPRLKERIQFHEGNLQEFGEPDILYLNDGWGRFQLEPWTKGRFLDAEKKPLPQPPLDWGLTASFRDINDDGFPDLFICNDYWTPDRLWLNDGQGHFQAQKPLAMRKLSASSMGVDFADINRDGLLDFITVDMLSRDFQLRKRQMVATTPSPPVIGAIDNQPQAPRNTLFLNRGDGTYTEIARLAGVDASEWSWSPVFLDVDLDGYEDILITTGHISDIQDIDANETIGSMQNNWRQQAQGKDLEKAFVEAKLAHARLYPPLQTPIVAFHNQRNLKFTDATHSWGLDIPGVYHGLALADLDNDGDLDFAVNRLGQVAGIFRNDSPAPRVAVRLQGKAPNTQAIGARIELVGGAAPHQKSEVTCGGSYMSGFDFLRTFAVGSASSNMSLKISWRDGTITELDDIQPNHLYVVSQKDADNRPLPAGEKDARPTRALFRDISDSLPHTHHEDPFDDRQRQPLLPRKLSQNGPGVAWFDLDQDGWEDLILGSGKGGRLSVYLNQAGQSFRPLHNPNIDTILTSDTSGLVGLRTSPTQTLLLAGSALYETLDTSAACVLQFEGTNATPTPLFPGKTPGAGPLASADLDGDGDLDLFVGGQSLPGRYPNAAPSLLFRRDEGTWILDQENTATLAGAGLINGAVWSHLDDDQWPELILACEWGPVRVFKNQAGTLVETTDKLKLAPHTGWWTGVTTGDFNNDGRLDIIAGNWGWNSDNKATPDQPLSMYYGNLGGNGMVDIMETEYLSASQTLIARHLRDSLQTSLPLLMIQFPSHLEWSQATLPQVLDGCPGPVHQTQATTLSSSLFLNLPDGFERHDLPVEAQYAPVFGINVADLDGDGNEDVFLAQNFFAFPSKEQRLDGGRGLWLRGDGKGHLEPVPGQISGIKVYGEQRGSALGDFNQDGRVDLVVSQNGAATKLYRNETGQPGLRVRLTGPDGNPDAVGAVARLKFDQDWGPAREIHAGSGYWSQDGNTMVLGTPKSPKSIHIRWPGGETQAYPIPAGSRELSLP